jgi:hypothetical protein
MYINRADLLQVLNYSQVFDPSVISELNQKYNLISEDDAALILKSNRLCALYMIQGLYELLPIFSSSIGSVTVVKDFVAQNKVLPGLEGFIRFIFFELEKDGYFISQNRESRESLSFRVVKQLPSLDEVRTEIESLFKIVHPLSPAEIDYVSSTGTKLAPMLTGKESALPHLFPEDPSAVSAEAYYMTAKMCSRAHVMVNDYLAQFFKVR